MLTGLLIGLAIMAGCGLYVGFVVLMWHVSDGAYWGLGVAMMPLPLAAGAVIGHVMGW